MASLGVAGKSRLQIMGRRTKRGNTVKRRRQERETRPWDIWEGAVRDSWTLSFFANTWFPSGLRITGGLVERPGGGPYSLKPSHAPPRHL